MDQSRRQVIRELVSLMAASVAVKLTERAASAAPSAATEPVAIPAAVQAIEPPATAVPAAIDAQVSSISGTSVAAPYRLDPSGLISQQDYMRVERLRRQFQYRDNLQLELRLSANLDGFIQFELAPGLRVEPELAIISPSGEATLMIPLYYSNVDTPVVAAVVAPTTGLRRSAIIRLNQGKLRVEISGGFCNRDFVLGEGQMKTNWLGMVLPTARLYQYNFGQHGQHGQRLNLGDNAYLTLRVPVAKQGLFGASSVPWFGPTGCLGVCRDRLFDIASLHSHHSYITMARIGMMYLVDQRLEDYLGRRFLIACAEASETAECERKAPLWRGLPDIALQSEMQKKSAEAVDSVRKLAYAISSLSLACRLSAADSCWPAGGEGSALPLVDESPTAEETQRWACP